MAFPIEILDDIWLDHKANRITADEAVNRFNEELPDIQITENAIRDYMARTIQPSKVDWH